VGSDDTVVLLGTPTPESSTLYAETMTTGDPTWAGPLAGSNLNLPVYHITENQISQQVEPSVYEAEVGLAEMVLDVEDIAQAVQDVRARTT